MGGGRGRGGGGWGGCGEDVCLCVCGAYQNIVRKVGNDFSTQV